MTTPTTEANAAAPFLGPAISPRSSGSAAAPAGAGELLPPFPPPHAVPEPAAALAMPAAEPTPAPAEETPAPAEEVTTPAEEVPAVAAPEAAPALSALEELPWLGDLDSFLEEPTDEPVLLEEDAALEPAAWEWPAESVDPVAELGFLDPGVLPWMDEPAEEAPDALPAREPEPEPEPVAEAEALDAEVEALAPEAEAVEVEVEAQVIETEVEAPAPAVGTPEPEAEAEEAVPEPGPELAEAQPLAPPVPAEAPLQAPLQAPRSAAGPPRPALTEVAARLEEIAQSLRQGAGSELLGARGGADPLRILITGYAIGYAEALRGGPEREEKEDSEGKGIG